MVIAACARQSATGGFNRRSDWTFRRGDIDFWVLATTTILGCFLWRLAGLWRCHRTPPTQAKWLLPRARGNQLQEASNGGPIGPPVVEILIYVSAWWKCHRREFFGGWGVNFQPVGAPNSQLLQRSDTRKWYPRATTSLKPRAQLSILAKDIPQGSISTKMVFNKIGEGGGGGGVCE